MSQLSIRSVSLVREPVGRSLWHGEIRPPTRWTMANILDLVCEAYDLSADALKSQARDRRIAWPRQHAMWLMAQQPHVSLPMIGRFLGDRDHTTIIHGVRAHQKRVDAQNPEVLAA